MITTVSIFWSGTCFPSALVTGFSIDVVHFNTGNFKDGNTGFGTGQDVAQTLVLLELDFHFPR